MSTPTQVHGLVLAATEGPSPLLPHLSELIVGIIAFALLFFFLWKKVLPMFEKTYSERTDAIEGGIARAEEAQAEAKRLLEQYQRQLAEARTEAAKIRDDARAEGTRIVEDLRGQAQEQADRIVARGEEALATERQRLVSEMRGDIGQLAVDLAGRIVGDSLADEARQRGTVDRFLAELDDSAAQPTGGAR